MGRETREGIVKRLPPGWTFNGKRVLDFGCGAGRTLRHFVNEAREAELWGCDIDTPSIQWAQDNLSPPFHVFVNSPEPPLDQPDSSFDLIWAISVFTHLSVGWAGWLLELHRLLKPDGLLFATFMGRGMVEEIAGETWAEDNFGMNVIRSGQSWDLGGPMVIHSPWWIQAHWGRAFDIVSLSPDGFAAKPWLDHGAVLMRKRPGEITARSLEAVSPGERRETLALAHNVLQLHRETTALRSTLSDQLAEDAQRKLHLEAMEDNVRTKTSEIERLVKEGDALRDDALHWRRLATIAQREASAAAERSVTNARHLLGVEEDLARASARIVTLENTLEELQPKLAWAEHFNSSMQASVSWRLTAPLRAFKQLLRRRR